MIALKNEDQVVCAHLTMGQTPTRSMDRAIRYVIIVACDGSTEPPRNRIWRFVVYGKGLSSNPKKQAASVPPAPRASLTQQPFHLSTTPFTMTLCPATHLVFM